MLTNISRLELAHKRTRLMLDNYKIKQKIRYDKNSLDFDLTRFYYTLAEGIMISARSLQRSEGDVSDPIKYMSEMYKKKENLKETVER